MDVTTLITNSLEYSDKYSEQYKNLFKDIKYSQIKLSTSDLDNNIIIFYDKDKNELFRSRYEVLGLYIPKTHTWVWGWAISQLKKNTTNIVRKIWNYGANLDTNFTFLKTELITSRFRISNLIQLDLHAGIASYLSKNPIIYKHLAYSQPEIDENNFRLESLDKEYIEIFYMFLLDKQLFDDYLKNKSV